MTLAARIIPCLDMRNGRVVKGVNFVDLRDAGDPAEQAAIYDAQHADEILRGDYQHDRAFRARFQQWMNGLWSEKDADMAALLEGGDPQA